MEKARILCLEPNRLIIILLQEQFDISYHTATLVIDQLEENRPFENEGACELEWEIEA